MFSQLNDPKFLNAGCNTWININGLVEGDPKGIEGRVTELIPELLLLKAYYDIQNKGFHANATERSVNLTFGGFNNSGTGLIVGGSEATHRWNDLLFVLGMMFFVTCFYEYLADYKRTTTTI